MSPLNDQLALQEIEGFLLEIDRNHYLWNDATHSDAHRLSDAALIERLPLIQDIADQVDPHLRGDLAQQGRGWRWRYTRETALRMRGILQSRDRADQIFGLQGPQLAAAGLHPWVWDAAASLWDDGYPKEAVGAAATAIDLRLQAKLGRNDISGAPLVTEAFAPSEPKPGSPRLRFADVEAGSQAWTDRHEGAMHYGRGCMQAIRNPAHHGGEVSDDQLALELLAALSVLAR